MSTRTDFVIAAAAAAGPATVDGLDEWLEFVAKIVDGLTELAGAPELAAPVAVLPAPAPTPITAPVPVTAPAAPKTRDVTGLITAVEYEESSGRVVISFQTGRVTEFSPDGIETARTDRMEDGPVGEAATEVANAAHSLMAAGTRAAITIVTEPGADGRSFRITRNVRAA